MDEDFAVKHFLVCRRLSLPRAVPYAPYTLHDVLYHVDVPEYREWPVRLGEVWVFARFYNGTGTRRFTVSVSWYDAGGEDADVAFFDVAVAFPPGSAVLDRGWNLSAVQFPGPGRYVFRLTDDATGALLADDYITLRRTP